MDTKDNNLIFMCVREVYRQDLQDKKSDLVVDMIGLATCIICLYWIIANDAIYGGWMACIATLIFMYVLLSDYAKYKKAKKKYHESL